MIFRVPAGLLQMSKERGAAGAVGAGPVQWRGGTVARPSQELCTDERERRGLRRLCGDGQNAIA